MIDCLHVLSVLVFYLLYALSRRTVFFVAAGKIFSEAEKSTACCKYIKFGVVFLYQ